MTLEAVLLMGATFLPIALIVTDVGGRDGSFKWILHFGAIQYGMFY